MCSVKIVKGNVEVGEIFFVFHFHPVDELFGCNALLLGAKHDGRAMGVIGTDIDAVVTEHALVADPDIGLNIT